MYISSIFGEKTLLTVFFCVFEGNGIYIYHRHFHRRCLGTNRISRIRR